MNDKTGPIDPPSAVLIRTVADWIRRYAAATIACTVAGVTLLSMATGLYVVANGESAALRRFGRLVDDDVGPGLHVRLPWGIDTATKVKTGTVFRLEIGGDVLKQLSLVTGDENLIDVVLVIQYKINRAGPFVVRAEEPTYLLTQAVRAAVVDAIAASEVELVLTSGKADVQNRVRVRAQAMLERYGIGITLIGVNLQSVTPPLEATQAFREVNDAKAEAARALNDAESNRERTLSLARGEASQLIEAARAGAAARVQRARGATDRFERLLRQKEVRAVQTRTDLYLDTVRRVLPRAKLLMLAPGQKPTIDLNLIERPRPRSDGNGTSASPLLPPLLGPPTR